MEKRKGTKRNEIKDKKGTDGVLKEQREEKRKREGCKKQETKKKQNRSKRTKKINDKRKKERKSVKPCPRTCAKILFQ
uniref:Uncharacterized protein n=1 Tax=Romanomermis culicivorax TaxID=13658 RepID=A0A915J9H9_ROMCU